MHRMHVQSLLSEIRGRLVLVPYEERYLRKTRDLWPEPGINVCLAGMSA